MAAAALRPRLRRLVLRRQGGDRRREPNTPDDSGDLDCETRCFFADADGDGFGNASATQAACAAPTGFGDDATDCDDADFLVSPAAAEICDERDDACDGLSDEGVQTSTRYSNGDHRTGIESCAPVEASVERGGDCDDHDERLDPRAAEDDCADPHDDNCDGSTGYADADRTAAWEDCNDGDVDVPGAAARWTAGASGASLGGVRGLQPARERGVLGFGPARAGTTVSLRAAASAGDGACRASRRRHPVLAHLGEAQVIAVTVDLGADRLLIDERQGRLTAEAMGVALVGSS